MSLKERRGGIANNSASEEFIEYLRTKNMKPADKARRELERLERIVDNFKYQKADEFVAKTTRELVKGEVLALKMKLDSKDVPRANALLDKLAEPKVAKICKYCGYQLKEDERKCPNCGGMV